MFRLSDVHPLSRNAPPDDFYSDTCVSCCYPCSRKEDNSQSTNIRHFDVVQNLIHQPIIELYEPAALIQQSDHLLSSVPD